MPTRSGRRLDLPYVSIVGDEIFQNHPHIKHALIMQLLQTDGLSFALLEALTILRRKGSLSHPEDSNQKCVSFEFGTLEGCLFWELNFHCYYYHHYFEYVLPLFLLFALMFLLLFSSFFFLVACLLLLLL